MAAPSIADGASCRATATPDIDRVLPQLEAIAAGAIESGTRDGYFAALYLGVTREVKRRVLLGEFDDGPRMDRLDALFAQRYLDAHGAYHAGRPVTYSWRVAFDAGQRWRPLILQHLLVGMNAHINLDLGIATVEAASGAPLSTLRPDFDRINGVLGSLTDKLEAGVAASAPLVSLLDVFAGRTDELLANFSIELARDGAFAFAEHLATLSGGVRQQTIDVRDGLIGLLGAKIVRPGPMLSMAILPLRLLERGKPAAITGRLL